MNNVSKTANDVFDKMMPRNKGEEASPISTIWSRLEADKLRQGKIRTKLLQSHVEHVNGGTSESSKYRLPSPEHSRRLQTSNMVWIPPKAECATGSSSTRNLDRHSSCSHSLPESLVQVTTKESSSCRLQSLSAMSNSAHGEESTYLFCDGSIADDHEEYDDHHHHREESNDSTQFSSTAFMQHQQGQGETLQSLGWTDFGQVEMDAESENDGTMEWMESMLPFSTSTSSRIDDLLPPPPAPEDSWNPSFDDQALLEVEPPAHLTNEEWIVLRQRREQRCLETTLRESRNFPSILGELGYPSENAVAGTRTASDHAVLLLRAEHDQRRRYRLRVARARMTRQARLEFLYHTTWRILGRTSLSILKFPARLLEKRYPLEPAVDTTFAAAVQPTASTVQWPESGNGWRFGEPNAEDYDEDATAYWSTGTAVESDSDSWTEETNEQASLPKIFLMDGHSLTQTLDPFSQDAITPVLPEETQFEV